ncbi:50S ribosomal protein L34e [Candidatus Woesearchaeota archaeon]|nr:50S ribosomal protein L34e [Candidatus Woesearchaeota archaeon]
MKWPTKSRSKRRIMRRTPGGRNVVHLKPRKQSKAHCAVCRQALKGVAQKGAASEKRPSRPYGGYLCSACVRQMMIERARA